MKALINADIYDFHDYQTARYILFEDTVRATGPMAEFPGAAAVCDCRGALVLPGMIVGHSHLYAALVRGLQLPFQPVSFRQLLEQLWWRFDRALDLEATYHSAVVSGIDHVKAGVTTLIDHHAGGAIRGSLNMLRQGLCDELGLRGVFCFETSDRFPVDECIAENLEFARETRSSQCRGMFGMHASLSLSDATLQKIAAALADQDLPIHVHVAESPEDEAESLACHGKRVLQRFDDFDLLTPDSLLAHCVHIDPGEAELIAQRGCTVALNPTSNLNNAVGLPDYPLFQQFNIPAIIGNDSLGVNITREYLNMLYGMHWRIGSPWRFSYDDLLACIRNGYDYAGKLLGIKLGRLAPGFAADMIVLPYRAPTEVNPANIFGHVVHGLFDRFQPRDVWCQGRLKVEKYQTVWDEEALYAKAHEAAARLWRRV